MIRKPDFKLFCRRKTSRTLVFLVVLSVLVWYTSSWFMMTGYNPQWSPEDMALRHYQRSRNLSSYMNDILILIEPALAPCRKDEVPVIILVASEPKHILYRHSVRKSWGKFLPTYFVLGLDADYEGDQQTDNRIEAKQFDDLIVFDFLDHQETLTLKTAMMMDWTLRRCPQAKFMMKTDEDVLINPRVLKNVLRENRDAKLIGHRKNVILVNRKDHNEWYMSRWLYHIKIVPQYLDGCGYLISGKYLKQVLKRAHQVPLINLEDIYFTYIVAYKSLGFPLQHDWRLSPKRPWLNDVCAYSGRALTLGYSPVEMLSAWEKIKSIIDGGSETCGFVSSILNSDLFLY